jgi:hypothetical protein
LSDASNHGDEHDPEHRPQHEQPRDPWPTLLRERGSSDYGWHATQIEEPDERQRNPRRRNGGHRENRGGFGYPDQYGNEEAVRGVYEVKRLVAGRCPRGFREGPR